MPHTEKNTLQPHRCGAESHRFANAQPLLHPFFEPRPPTRQPSLALTRTHFHSSSLMRALADLQVAGTAVAGTSFAEKLGLWVSFTDAIALNAVHSQSFDNARFARGAPQSAQIAKRGQAISEDVACVRAGLVDLITQRGARAGGKAFIKLPEPPDAAPAGAAAYEPYRRFYTAHQREMEAAVGPLRARVRAALAPMGPALQQLAALDAALDKILIEREAKLLSKVASLLQLRFVHLLRSHQQHSQGAAAGTEPCVGQIDPPALRIKDGGWPAGFCHELQTVLLAELDLRLQPTLGLLEATKNETTPWI